MPSPDPTSGAEIARRADAARAVLEGAAPADTDALARGLRDALDVGLLLAHERDRGAALDWSVAPAVERLLRATAQTYPPLAAKERKAKLEGAAEASLYSTLSARAITAQRKLTKALEGLYRGLTDAQEES